MSALKRKEILPGIYFGSVSDEKFKTNQISMNLILPLRSETAAYYALIPNLLRKGYQKYPDFTEFNRYLDRLYGASVDGGVSKMGDSQMLTLSVIGVDDRFTLEKEQLTTQLCELLCGMLLQPVMENGVFPEQEVRLEKKTLSDQIKAEINDKRSYALNQATRLLCPNEPYGLSPYGTLEQVEAIDAENLAKAYQTLIQTARIEILFVGSGNAEAAQEICQKHFEAIHRSYQAALLCSPHTALPKTAEQVEHMDVSQSKMVLGFSTGLAADCEQLPALRLMTAILGGTPTSKLFLNVREKLSLCYYCVARIDRSKGLVKIDCGVENANIQKAKAEILNQLQQMQDGNITDQEISDAVMSLENTYRTINDSNAAIASFYLGGILLGGTQTPEEEAKSLKKVTQEQLVEVSRLLKLDACYLLTSGEKGE